MRAYLPSPQKLTAQDVLQWPSITNVVYLSDEERWESLPHFHSSALELLFIFKGRCHLLIAGAEYVAEPGDLVVYHRGVIHHEVFMGGRGNQESISIRTLDCHIRQMEEGRLLPPGVPCVLFTDVWRPEMELCFRALYEELKEQRRGFTQVANNYLQMLMLLIFRLINEGAGQPRGAQFGLCGSVRQYIEHNYHKNILVRDIARALGVSHSHLTHAFTSEVGVSPQQYLITQRILEAKRLLIMSDMPVFEVAQTVGFPSAPWFNAQFRQSTGVSPGSYRSANRGIPDHVNLIKEG